MRIRVGGYYIHALGNSVFRVAMVVSLKNGVQQVYGRFVNKNGDIDTYACKRDDFLEEFCSLTPKAAEKLLESWALAKEVLE